MAKTPETVESFLEELAVKLQPLWAKEREVMLKLKVRYTITNYNNSIAYDNFYLE